MVVRIDDRQTHRGRALLDALAQAPGARVVRLEVLEPYPPNVPGVIVVAYDQRPVLFAADGRALVRKVGF